MLWKEVNELGTTVLGGHLMRKSWSTASKRVVPLRTAGSSATGWVNLYNNESV